MLEKINILCYNEYTKYRYNLSCIAGATATIT